MTDFTIAAPVPATKAPTRDKAAPTAAPLPAVEKSLDNWISDDEKTVAAAASTQLQHMRVAIRGEGVQLSKRTIMPDGWVIKRVPAKTLALG